MKPVTIYTTPSCGYCFAAKRLLRGKGVAFEEIDVSADPARRAEMIAAGDRGAGRCRRSSSAARGSAASTTSPPSIGRASSTRCSRTAEMRAALIQLCSGDDPAANLVATEALVREAAAGGAALALTPECTNIVSSSRVAPGPRPP